MPLRYAKKKNRRLLWYRWVMDVHWCLCVVHLWHVAADKSKQVLGGCLRIHRLYSWNMKNRYWFLSLPPSLSVLLRVGEGKKTQKLHLFQYRYYLWSLAFLGHVSEYMSTDLSTIIDFFFLVAKEDQDSRSDFARPRLGPEDGYLALRAPPPRY